VGTSDLSSNIEAGEDIEEEGVYMHLHHSVTRFLFLAATWKP